MRSLNLTVTSPNSICAALADDNLDLVLMLARIEMRAGRTRVPFDELVAAGNVGLFRAALGYDGRPTCQFRTYAQRWIVGAIKDDLRARNIFGRYKIPLMRAPETAAKHVAGPDFEKQLIARLTVDKLIGTLTPRQARIIRMRYFDEMTEPAIASILGVGQSWISQLTSAALTGMRAAYGST